MPATLQGVPFSTLATRKATSPRICTTPAAMRSTTPSIDAQSPSVPGATLSMRPLMVQRLPWRVTVTSPGLAPLILAWRPQTILRASMKSCASVVGGDLGALDLLCRPAAARRGRWSARPAAPTAPARAAARDNRRKAAAALAVVGRPAASGQAPEPRAGRPARSMREVGSLLWLLPQSFPAYYRFPPALGAAFGAAGAAGAAPGPRAAAPAVRRAARPRPAARCRSRAARCAAPG